MDAVVDLINSVYRRITRKIFRVDPPIRLYPPIYADVVDGDPIMYPTWPAGAQESYNTLDRILDTFQGKERKVSYESSSNRVIISYGDNHWSINTGGGGTGGNGAGGGGGAGGVFIYYNTRAIE